MTPELKNELDEMERQAKAPRSSANFGPDPKALLTSIYLIRAVDQLDTSVGKLDRTSTRLWIVNIVLSVLVLIASVLAIFKH